VPRLIKVGNRGFGKTINLLKIPYYKILGAYKPDYHRWDVLYYINICVGLSDL